MRSAINKYLFTVFFCLCGIGTLLAQKGYSNLSYSIGIPSGDLTDYIDQASGRGLSFDYNRMITENLALGIGAGWQIFYQEMGYTTTTNETGTVSGIEYRYLNSIPVHLTGTYFFTSDKPFKPFATLGIGTIFNKRDQDIGIYRYTDNSWHFSLRPEAGFQYDINYYTGMRVSLRYNQAFAAGDIGAASYIALALGIVWIR